MLKKSRQPFLVGMAILVFVTTLFAQSSDTLWTKTYGGSDLDAGFSVRQTSDGGYIIAGNTSSFGGGNGDVYLIKTDANGDSVWTKTYGSESYEAGHSVRETSDGGYIITGYALTFETGSPDVYLIKTDANGSTLWIKTYGGTDEDYGYSVYKTSDGGYIVAGYVRSFITGVQDVYVVKTDENGDTLWTKTYGGDGAEYGYSVCQTSDGGYIIAGGSSSFSPDYDAYLIKTNESGDTLWTKTYGGTESDMGHSVCQTTDGGYIIAGNTSSSGEGDADVYLVKTDVDGHAQWTNTYGGSELDGGFSVCETSDGGYIIAGYTSSFGADAQDVYVVRTDGNGDTLWTKKCGGTASDYGYSVCETTDGGYIIAGVTSSFGAGQDDVWLVKTAPYVGIEEQKVIQEPFVVSEITPNPFTDRTSIRYSLPRSSYVDIALYDPLGRKVKTLVDDLQNAETHVVTWGGSDDAGKQVSSGVYFIKFEAGEERYTGKVVLMR